MILLDIVTTVCIGLLIGTELTVSVFINPILQRLETGTRMKVTSLFGKRLGTAMPFWYVFGFLLLITETVLRWHSNSGSLLITATALWLAAIGLSVLVLVPINNRIIRLAANSPAEASFKEHAKWDLLHRGRVAILTASMVCFLLAILR